MTSYHQKTTNSSAPKDISNNESDWTCAAVASALDAVGLVGNDGLRLTFLEHASKIAWRGKKEREINLEEAPMTTGRIARAEMKLVENRILMILGSWGDL